MVHPHAPRDQAGPLDQLRYDADLAIARMLRTAVESASSNAEAVELLNVASARLHQDIAIYRRRLTDDLADARRRPRTRLRLVPTAGGTR